MPNRHSNQALIALGAFLCVLASVGLALMVTIARAHTSDGGMTYSAYCCTGDAVSGDCAEVHDSTVRAVEGGWAITLRKGQHRMVKSAILAALMSPRAAAAVLREIAAEIASQQPLDN